MKRKIVIGLAAVAMLVSACGVGKLKEEGKAFMEALKAGDAQKTFDMTHESLQKEVGGLEGWTKWIENRKPSKWNFTGFNVNANGTSRLDGDVEFPSGTKADLVLSFTKVGEGLKVSGLSFSEKK